MYLLELKNRKSIDINLIPSAPFDEFEKIVCAENYRVISLFAQENLLYAILTEETNTKLFVSSTAVGDAYPSFTLKKPALHLFEREIFEKNNITPIGHPFLKPVREQKYYEFLKSSDLQTHEVAVGPVHAGIIEPGHFRFLCNGERVNHLEIMLGYQKRGVEKMLCKKPSITLAESICGDSTVAYAKTFAEIIENLSNIEVDEKSKNIRIIALELERLGIHLGDIGAIAGDVAYQIGANVLAVTRTLAINTTLDICGNRFGKGLIKFGGVNYDINIVLVKQIQLVLDEIKERLNVMADAMFSNATVLSRLENTGCVTKKRAKEIGMVGMAARASGLQIDSRRLDDENFTIKSMKNGDVYSRAYQRYLEALQSIEIIENLLPKLTGEISKERKYINLKPNSFVVAINESWRGELCHCCATDENGYLKFYKIKDASFNNWFGLALAVRNNQISDFPVCNKSFDLSYCGFDL